MIGKLIKFTLLLPLLPVAVLFITSDLDYEGEHSGGGE